MTIILQNKINYSFIPNNFKHRLQLKDVRFISRKKVIKQKIFKFQFDTYNSNVTIV